MVTPETIDRLACLVIIDALLEGSSRYWLKRAADFAAVGTPACDAIAQACRNRATLCGEDRDEWADLLAIELDGAA